MSLNLRWALSVAALFACLNINPIANALVASDSGQAETREVLVVSNQGGFSSSNVSTQESFLRTDLSAVEGRSGGLFLKYTAEAKLAVRPPCVYVGKVEQLTASFMELRLLDLSGGKAREIPLVTRMTVSDLPATNGYHRKYRAIFELPQSLDAGEYVVTQGKSSGVPSLVSECGFDTQASNIPSKSNSKPPLRIKIIQPDAGGVVAALPDEIAGVDAPAEIRVEPAERVPVRSLVERFNEISMPVLMVAVLLLLPVTQAQRNNRTSSSERDQGRLGFPFDGNVEAGAKVSGQAVASVIDKVDAAEPQPVPVGEHAGAPSGPDIEGVNQRSQPEVPDVDPLVKNYEASRTSVKARTTDASGGLVGPKKSPAPDGDAQADGED